MPNTTKHVVSAVLAIALFVFLVGVALLNAVSSIGSSPSACVPSSQMMFNSCAPLDTSQVTVIPDPDCFYAPNPGVWESSSTPDGLCPVSPISQDDLEEDDWGWDYRFHGNGHA